MNIKRRAVTQYHGLTFNSACIFRDRPLLLADDGIYDFGYAYQSDDGTAISAFFQFVATDLGIPNHKALRSMHLSYMSSGSLRLTWTADEVVERAEEVLAETSGENYRDVKVRGNRKVEGTYLEFRVENRGGADFSLNAIRAVPIVKNLGKSN